MPKVRPRWVIVGGEDRGGILCREGQELGSAKLSMRLSTGAVVEELRLIGERLHFLKVTGRGPNEGWISVFLDHKDLAKPLAPALGDFAPLPSEPTKTTEELCVPQDSPASAPANSGAASLPDSAPESTHLSSSLGEAPGVEHHDAAAEATHAEPGRAEGTSRHATPTQNPSSGDHSGGAAPDFSHDEAAPEASASREEADWDRGKPRFERRPAKRIPVDVSSDLKWFVWNEIWRIVNNKLGGMVDGKKREDHFKEAEKDEERSCWHFRQVLERNAFSNGAVLQVKRQASAAGMAVAAGHSRGVWLYAARVLPLDPPSEMEAELWSNLVKAIRTAAVAIHMMSQHHWDKAGAFQSDYEQAWKDIEEDSTLAAR